MVTLGMDELVLTKEIIQKFLQISANFILFRFNNDTFVPDVME